MAISQRDGFEEMDRKFLTRAMRTPLLTQEEEYDLIRRWRDGADDRALHHLISAYMRLVIAAAGKFRQYGLPLADLVQEGSLGLLQAASRFDLERNVRFSTYAMWWVRSAMQEYVLRNWSIVRSGSSAAQKALFFKLRWLRARIEGRNPELPSSEVRDRIAAALKVAPADVEAMMMRLSGRDSSLDQPLSEDGDDSAADFLPDPGPTPDEIVEHRHDLAKQRSWLAAAIEELTPREQLIIRRRQLADEGSTLEELGDVLGVTKERVRQIEAKALDKVRASVVRRSRTPEPCAALPC